MGAIEMPIDVGSLSDDNLLRRLTALVRRAERRGALSAELAFKTAWG